MVKETVDIVNDLINELEIKVNFDQVFDNLDGTYTISTKNTGYLFPTYEFQLSGVNYKVLNQAGKEFEFNNKFTVKGNAAPIGSYLIMDNIKYYHGTVIATKEELKQKELSKDKFPMAFLLEVLDDEFNNEDDSSIDRESQIRLFFLSETDESNWNTNEHYEYSIKPMRNLVYNFIYHLNRSNKIGKFNSYNAINHAKFGVYVSGQGHTKRIFNDKLSGVELRINLPIKKSRNCSC